MAPPFVLLLLLLPLLARGAASSDGRARILEGSPQGTYVFSLASLHPSGALGGTSSFYLLTFKKYFSLNARTGVLITRRPIDLEAPATCNDNPRCCPSARNERCLFDIKASVRSRSASSLLTVWVIVMDVNDNSPRFPTREISLRFPEGHEAVSSRRGVPLAVDLDFTAENRRLRYSLKPETNAHFVLREERGKDGPQALYLSLAAPLDAEEATSHALSVVAMDTGGRRDELRVNVSVVDRNEFAPVFAPGQQTEFSISEREPAGFIVTTLVATDNDAPPNNRVRYLLLPSSPQFIRDNFEVDANNGTVRLRRRLDYEKHQRLTLHVQAVDGGRGSEERSAQIALTVHVVDWNDNAPTINVDRDGGAITIRENRAKFTRIASVFVEDKDSGRGGRVSCVVLTHSDLFSVAMVQDSVYALESRASLDRERQERYNVTIECADRGRTPRRSRRTLVVVVEDENDCYPTFDRTLYTFWVWENATKGSPLLPSQPGQPGRVVVTDPDVEGRLNLFLEDVELTGQPVSQAGAFAITPNGTLVTNRPLDSEVAQSYNFKVCATDGRFRQCGEVVVEVKDVNDHAPVFERSEVALSIPENEPSHGEVAAFSVSDADVGNKGFKFRLRSPENIATRYFHLKDNRLMLSHALDRERVGHLTFFVVVEDSQEAGIRNHTAAAKVYVNVIDRNDNAPRFLVPNETLNVFNVSFHEPVGARVLRLTAADPDEGENGTVSYKVVYTKPYRATELFGIDADDFLIVCSDLLSGFAGHRIEMMVRASDHALSPRETTQKLTLRLVDIPPSYRRQTVERRNLLILILGASALFLLMLLLGWGIHYYRTRNTRRRIMHPPRHKMNYPEEQALGSLRRYSLDLNNELIYHSSKKKLLSVERASTIDERLSHDSGRGCSIDQDNGSVRKLISEPRCASILSRSRQTPPILTAVAAPVTSTAPRSASALAKIPNFCTPPVQRRNTVDGGLNETVVADTLPARMDTPLKSPMCTTPEMWTGNSPNGSTCGKGVKNPYVSMPEITTSYV